jgi:hypothetical protein
MNRRKTVSVTPAIGASTVAGDMVTDPMRTDEGTTAGVGPTFRSDQPSLRSVPVLSQNFFMQLHFTFFRFYFLCATIPVRLGPALLCELCVLRG